MFELRWLAPFFRLTFIIVLLQSAEFLFAEQPPAAANEAFTGVETPYGVGDWPEALGNHRAKIRVEGKADAVWVHLPWRRRDEGPEKKDIQIFDAATGAQVKNIFRVRIDNESGDLLFQPATVPGDYYVYFMPFKLEPPDYCPTTVYLPPKDEADPAWNTACEPLAKQIADGKTDGLAATKVLEFQAINDFHRFDPMEIPATAAEMKKLLADRSDKAYLVFPEDRTRPIRMTEALPARWIRSGPVDSFRGEACRGEYYVFQLGVYAVTQDVAAIGYSATPFVKTEGKDELGPITCYNLEGVDWKGRRFTKKVTVAKGRVQPLWFGVQVPENAAPGEYRTKIAIRPENLPPAEVSVSINVLDQTIKNSGDDDLWRYARLRWLNSTIGLDDDPVPPYTPVKRKDRTVEVLGRTFRFGDDGFLESICGTFNRSVDRMDAPPREILAGPIRFLVETADGEKSFTGGNPKVLDQKSGAIAWKSTSRAGSLALHCEAKLESDGYVNYWLTLSETEPKEVVELKDVRLEIPIAREVAKYMMGLGRKGGNRPDKWDWKWDARYANSHFWIGDVGAGLGGKFKHLEDRFDVFNMQQSGTYEDWSNGGQGGARLREEPDRVVLTAFTGPRKLEPGKQLHFNFGLMATPFHTITQDHWSWRYIHPYPWTPLPTADEAAATGAKIMMVHQGGNGINQHINYPFVTNDLLKKYIDAIHAKDMKIKIYYTMRELSNYTAEIWALRSLGDEIYLSGPGFRLADQFDADSKQWKAGKVATGSSWLVEHLVHDYSPAWHQPLGNGFCDSAIATQGLSRWHNYYLEGLNWLTRVQDIDGVYFDGAGFDREIIKRMRKVANRAKPGCLFDYHQGNNFQAEYGWSNPASAYLELFPYFDSLWFGEGFNYNEPSDYWLVEISGIPFGLTGEMLQDGGNPWRGMLYGMTTRLPWSGDPRPIWKVWADFGIDRSRMIGYWDSSCPVKTGRDDILATAYVREGKTLVSVASWAAKREAVKLQIDWKSLGLDPAKTKIVAPAIDNFQSAKQFSPTDEIPVEPARGWLLILSEE